MASLVLKLFNKKMKLDLDETEYIELGDFLFGLMVGFSIFAIFLT